MLTNYIPRSEEKGIKKQHPQAEHDSLRTLTWIFFKPMYIND